MALEHAYAQAVYRAAEKGGKPEALLQALQKNLESRGRLGLSKSLANALRRLAQKESARDARVLFVQDMHDAKQALHEVKKEFGLTLDESRVKEDTTLIGGYRLEGGGELIDRSFKKQLLDMYQRIIS